MLKCLNVWKSCFTFILSNIFCPLWNKYFFWLEIGLLIILDGFTLLRNECLYLCSEKWIVKFHMKCKWLLMALRVFLIWQIKLNVHGYFLVFDCFALSSVIIVVERMRFMAKTCLISWLFFIPWIQRKSFLWINHYVL